MAAGCRTVHGRVLLAGRAQRRPGRRRHGRVRVGAAKLPELPAGARIPLGVVGRLDRIEMARDQRVHADIRPDQTGVDVDGLGRNRSRRLALPYDTREDPAKDVLAPTLPDARQGGVIRQRLVQRVPDETSGSRC